MIAPGTRVTTPDGPGTVIEYVRQQTESRGEYVERPAVLLHDGEVDDDGVQRGTLKAFVEADLTVEV